MSNSAPVAPALLYTRHIAAALNVTERQVKYWLDIGELPGRRIRDTGQRFITPADLQQFSDAKGLTINWQAIPIS